MAQGAGSRDDADALLHHPEVVRMVRAIMLVFRVLDQDMGDCTADVQERFLKTIPPEKRPKDLPGMKAVVRKVAYNVGKEKVKEAIRHGNYNVGATDAADEHAKSLRLALEPHEDAAIREIVEQAIREEAAGKHTEAIVGALMTGQPPRETAKDAGIPASQMRKKTSQLRALLRDRLVQVGIAMAGVALLSLGGVGLYDHQQQMEIRDSFDSTAAPPRDWHRSVVWAPLGDIPNADKAAVLREQAAAECAARKWDPCTIDLDQSIDLDPSSAQLPEVKALRALLNASYNAKPRER